LRTCQEKSYGIRLEYRVSWRLFELIDIAMRRLGPAPSVSSHRPSQLGWIALATQQITEFFRWNINKFCFGFEMLYSSSPDISIPWDHSRVMFAFLMCLPAFLGRSHPNTFRRLWCANLPAKADSESVERGLGIGNNLTTYGYGWLDPVIDYQTMTFRTEYTDYIGFDRLPLLGNFQKKYHLAAGFWHDRIVVRRAEQWLRQFSNNPLQVQFIAELFRQICLRAFRRDVYASIKHDLTKEKDLRGKALRGECPLTYSTLQAVFRPGASRVCFAISHNQSIREYASLFRLLWDTDDNVKRGPWAQRTGYRDLYQMCREALSRIVGHEFATEWRGRLREYLRQTHWLLPYPGASLISRNEQGASKWWTNYNESIDNFNRSKAPSHSQPEMDDHESTGDNDSMDSLNSRDLPEAVDEPHFELDADVMKEWPTVPWADRMQDFR
jgi:hypothetical protein